MRRPLLIIAVLVAVVGLAAYGYSFLRAYQGNPAERPFQVLRVSSDRGLEGELKADLERYASVNQMKMRASVFPSETLGRGFLFYLQGRRVHIIAQNKIYDGVPRPESHEGAINPHFEQNSASVAFYTGRGHESETEPVRSAAEGLEQLLKQRGLMIVQRPAASEKSAQRSAS